MLQPSIATQIARTIWQKNQKANCSLFPGTFLYSFEQEDLWLSLTFLPSSETSTQVRYDLFASSPKTGINADTLNSAVAEVLQNSINSIEVESLSATEKPLGNSPITHRILKQLQEHQKLERTSGGLVRPAMRQPKGSSLFQQAEQRESLSLLAYCCNFEFLLIYHSVQGNRLFWSWITGWNWKRARLVDARLLRFTWRVIFVVLYTAKLVFCGFFLYKQKASILFAQS